MNNSNALPKAKELKPQIDKVITPKNILSNKKRLFQNSKNQNSVKKFLKNYLKDIVLEKVVTQEF